MAMGLYDLHLAGGGTDLLQLAGPARLDGVLEQLTRFEQHLEVPLRGEGCGGMSAVTKL